jgi:LemA protein
MNSWKIILVVVVLVCLFGACSYNSVVTRDEECNEAWGNVESVLQRRFDLIPNLVNTVKGYAAHEKETLEEITRLRSQWGAAKSPDEKLEAATGIERALARLLVVTENYPELKANENFIRLQDELSGTENRINVERQRYNAAVKNLNLRVRGFPGSFFARMAGIETRKPFEAAEAAATAPTVQF